MNLRKFLNSALTPSGYKLSRRIGADPYPSDFTSDEYFQKHGIAFHLRVDSSSRVGVKIG